MGLYCLAIVQLLGRVQLFVTPLTSAHQASLSFTVSQSLLKLMSVEVVMPSSHLILCRPLLLLPSIFPSRGALRIRWPKYWSFSFSISPPSKYSGLVSFRMNWLDLLAIRRALKSLPQHHSSKAWYLPLSELHCLFAYLIAVLSISLRYCDQRLSFFPTISEGLEQCHI